MFDGKYTIVRILWQRERYSWFGWSKWREAYHNASWLNELSVLVYVGNNECPANDKNIFAFTLMWNESYVDHMRWCISSFEIFYASLWDHDKVVYANDYIIVFFAYCFFQKQIQFCTLHDNRSFFKKDDFFSNILKIMNVFYCRIFQFLFCDRFTIEGYFAEVSHHASRIVENITTRHMESDRKSMRNCFWLTKLLWECILHFFPFVLFAYDCLKKRGMDTLCVFYLCK